MAKATKEPTAADSGNASEHPSRPVVRLPALGYSIIRVGIFRLPASGIDLTREYFRVV
jgi:hypothetical protein